MKITVAQAIVRCLELEGIEYAFGITGSHYLSFFNALKDSAIKYISVKHEGAAGFMALNYAKVAQKPALLLGTAGPGAMNLLNGVAELYKAGIPAVILTPLVPREKFGKNSTQEDSGWGNSYSIMDVMRCVTRKSLLANSAQKVPDLMRELFRYGLYQNFGPVHIGIPSDLFEEEIDFLPLEPSSYRMISDERIELEKVTKLSKLIAEADRPLLLIGGRSVYPDCSKEINELINSFHIPFVLTHNAKGIMDEKNEYFCGILNFWGHKSAEKIVKEADLICSIGEDFNEEATMRYDPDLFKNSNLVSIDSNYSEVGRNYPVLFGISGGLKSTLNYLMQQLKSDSYINSIDIPLLRGEIDKVNTFYYEEREQKTSPLKPQTIFFELSKSIPKGTSVFLDVGAASWWSVRNLIVSGYRYYISGTGFSMAQAVTGCVGGKCAEPGKPSICICGDGAFLMHGNEVLTAVQYNLGITWIIFKEDYYNMIQMNQCMTYDGKLDFCSRIKNPDYSLLAKAFGCHYFRIDEFEDIKNSLLNALAANDKNQGAFIEVAYDYKELLPIKPRLIAIMKDLGQTKDIKSNPYLMKAFTKALKEKV
jgi:acetolactate synthase I/II/III large subunit